MTIVRNNECSILKFGNYNFQIHQLILTTTVWRKSQPQSLTVRTAHRITLLPKNSEIHFVLPKFVRLVTMDSLALSRLSSYYSPTFGRGEKGTTERVNESPSVRRRPVEPCLFSRSLYPLGSDLNLCPKPRASKRDGLQNREREIPRAFIHLSRSRAAAADRPRQTPLLLSLPPLLPLSLSLPLFLYSSRRESQCKYTNCARSAHLSFRSLLVLRRRRRRCTHMCAECMYVVTRPISLRPCSCASLFEMLRCRLALHARHVCGHAHVYAGSSQRLRRRRRLVSFLHSNSFFFQTLSAYRHCECWLMHFFCARCTWRSVNTKVDQSFFSSFCFLFYFRRFLVLYVYCWFLF